ncbi:MAG: TetR/AcrR family transcriptional regulator [Dehalococcoidales bacterium]|nr:TetR/AcrR family transcriptional regulator [Dehalococcoidales bacterium]
MNGFIRRSTSLKQKILSASADLLASQGVKKTSINQISKKARVSPVTIYNYFGSKAGLVTETIKYLATQKLEEAEKLLNERRPYLDRLAELVFLKSSNLNQYHPELLKEMAATKDPELKEYLEGQVYPEAMKTLNDFLEEGKSSGYIRPELSARSIQMFTDMFKHLASSYPQIYDNSPENHRLINEIWRIYLYGLMGQETHPELFSVSRPRAEERD